MYNRYNEIKNLYKNYLIIIKVKDKYKTIGMDNRIYEYLNLKKFKYLKNKQINYLILDNLDIVEKKDNENNRYDEYYIKTKLTNVLRVVERRLANEEY